MPKQNAIYRPVSGTLFRFSGRRLWQAPDHLLLIGTRLFRETYVRIYWADIQTAVLYPLSRRRSPERAFEILCLLAVAVSAPFTGILQGSLFAGLFILSYLSWRFSQPGWACQISTKIGTYRFALANTLSSSRRIVEDINAHTLAAQGPLEETPIYMQARVAVNQKTIEARRTKLPLYAIAFGLGLLAPLNSALVVLYYFALVPLLFLRRDFEFPPSVRAATVMSLILAVLCLAWWLIYLRDPLVLSYSYRLRMPSEIHILRALFSLFGIGALYWQSVEHSRYQPNNSTVLGLS